MFLRYLSSLYCTSRPISRHYPQLNRNLVDMFDRRCLKWRSEQLRISLANRENILIPTSFCTCRQSRLCTRCCDSYQQIRRCKHNHRDWDCLAANSNSLDIFDKLLHLRHHTPPKSVQRGSSRTLLIQWLFCNVSTQCACPDRVRSSRSSVARTVTGIVASCLRS